MLYKEYSRQLDPHIFGGLNGKLSLSTNHFSNKIVIQIRIDGQMDSTYEIKSKGLSDQDIGAFNIEDPHVDDDYAPIRDPLSNFEIVTRVGDSSDMKIPIVCTQIAQLFERVILPMTDAAKGSQGNKAFVITLGTKPWRKSDGNDFAKLLFILKCIKDAYTTGNND